MQTLKAQSFTYQCRTAGDLAVAKKNRSTTPETKPYRDGDGHSQSAGDLAKANRELDQQLLAQLNITASPKNLLKQTLEKFIEKELCLEKGSFTLKPIAGGTEAGFSGNPVFKLTTKKDDYIVKVFINDEPGNGFSEETKAMLFLNHISKDCPHAKFPELVRSGKTSSSNGEIPVIIEELAKGEPLSCLFEAGTIRPEATAHASAGLADIGNYGALPMQPETKAKIAEQFQRLEAEFEKIKILNNNQTIVVPPKTMHSFQKLIAQNKESFQNEPALWGQSVYSYGDVAHGNIFFDEAEGASFIDPPSLLSSMKEDGSPTGIDGEDIESFQAHIRMNGHKCRIPQATIANLLNASEASYQATRKSPPTKIRPFLKLLNAAMPVGLWVKPEDAQHVYKGDQDTLQLLVNDFIAIVESQSTLV